MYKVATTNLLYFQSTEVERCFINDSLMSWACVYAAKRWLCAGAILQCILFFLNGLSVISGGLVT
jgi:hypothetical protein